ncbi:MAG: hypothetical protein K2K70_08925, partial [Lachnospiraceae bacterium]|nr:hypothetical protein [Lachnospiraceae bacterium]
IIGTWWNHAWEKRISDTKVEQLQKIYVGKNRSSVIQIYRKKLGKALGMLGIILCLLLVLFLCSDGEEERVDGQDRIKRQEPGGAIEEVELKTHIAGQEETVTVAVAPRQYTAEELQAEFTRARQYVLQTYLGTNDSPDQILYDLQLETELPDSAVQLEWQTDSAQLIEGDGSVHWDQIEQETAVEITAILQYGEEEETMPLQLTLLPPQRTVQEQLWRSWGKSQEILAEQTESENYLQLPRSVEGERVQYEVPHRAMWKYVLFGASVGIFVIPLLLESRIRQTIVKRDRELLMDYPEMVEQYVLLIGAGMTIKGAWIRIASDYLSMRQKGQQEYRYVYEEMLVTMRELDSGMSELRAYELFGKRTGILSYMKFSTLLMQNLRKGSDDLLRILEYEAVDAFRQRKEHARALGEEVGTKLLMPMMLMLLVVLMMIIYAAFRSM